MPQIKWTTQKRVIKKLIPHSTNPRELSEKQRRDLMKSIEKFDFVEIPVINLDDTLLAGHQRLKIMSELGRGDEEIDVRVPSAQLSEQDAKEYLIRSNKNTGTWDYSMLQSSFEFDDLVDWGFDTEDLGNLFEEPEKEGLTDPDNVPDLPVEPVTKLGDIYKLGNHRLMCGDSTSIDAVEKLMDGHKADMVFTDPPYGVSYTNNMNNNHNVIMNDDVFLDILPVLVASSKENIHWYIWTSQQVYPTWREMFNDYYKNTIIWSKGGGGIGDLAGDYALNYEMALYCQYGRRELNGSRDGAVWEIKKDAGSKYVHPTQKPTELAGYAIDKSSFIGNSVLDLFGGSGSTLIACEKTGRNARLMELDPKYCDVIVKRWEEFTGKKAELLEA